MQMNRNRIVILTAVIALLAFGAGYMIENVSLKQTQKELKKAAADSEQIKKDMAAVTAERDDALAKLAEISKQSEFAPKLEPYMVDSLKKAGLTGPEQLVKDLGQNPSVIPEEAVLGGTMHFTGMGIIDDHWVYGSYEDGHIAGAAVFQWEIRDSGIIWTPVLVFRE